MTILEDRGGQVHDKVYRLGTFRQIDARTGSCGNGSSSNSPNIRDRASGTTFTFYRGVFNGKVKVLQRNSPTSNHIWCILHIYRWVSA